MQQQREPEPFGFISFDSFLGLMLFIARTFAVTIEVFLRRADTFGDRYFGMQAVAALPLLFFFPIVTDGEGMLTFLNYIGTYLAACLVIRVRCHWRRRRGTPPPHSYYSGTPHLMRWTGRMREADVKGGLEPFLVFLFAIVCTPVSPALAIYLICASIGLMASIRAAIASEHLRVLDLHDAYLEQRQVAERFRNLRGE